MGNLPDMGASAISCYTGLVQHIHFIGLLRMINNGSTVPFKIMIKFLFSIFLAFSKFFGNYHIYCLIIKTI